MSEEQQNEVEQEFPQCCNENVILKDMVYEVVRCAVCHHSPKDFSVKNLIMDFLDGMALIEESVEPLVSATTAQTSICNDYVICLECGEQFKQISSKHLSMHGLTPAEYKAKWGFKKGQSLSCLKTAKQRSKAAKKRGVPEGLLKSIEDKRQARAAAVETPAPKPKRTRTPVAEEAPEEKRPETRRRRRQTEEEAA